MVNGKTYLFCYIFLPDFSLSGYTGLKKKPFPKQVDKKI